MDNKRLDALFSGLTRTNEAEDKQPIQQETSANAPSTIQADDTYLCSIEETEINVLEHLFLILFDGFAHSHHRENNLLVVCCWHLFSFVV